MAERTRRNQRIKLIIMSWFEINGTDILSKNNLSRTIFGTTERWGIYIGGRWCLDYTWKLVFGISDEAWNEKAKNIKTNKDFYDFCEWLGVYYKGGDNKIHRKGLTYNELGEEIN